MTPQDKAREIVDKWHQEQLRNEGRAGLYFDGIVGLTYDFEKALIAQIEECAKVADEHGMQWDDSWGNACRAVAAAIRQLKGDAKCQSK